jgi:lipid-A-disaccharide synthase
MSQRVDILLLSGEKSGDQLAQQLIHDIKAELPHVRIAGMGGQSLQATGMEIVVDNQDLAIIGFIEVLKKIGPIWRAWQKLKAVVKRDKPLVILVDYPGMNLRFAKLAKKQGCRVLYYVSPQIWAWKAYRLKTIQHAVDHMAVFFPFEKTIYDQAGVPCTVVGHPLTKNTQRCDQIDTTARTKLGFSHDKPLVALCPGSRSMELTQLLPVILQTTKLLPNCQFALLSSSSVNKEQLADVPASIRILGNEHLHAIFHAADAGIVVSGTITLEAACHQLPMTVIYKVSALNYWLGKKLIKTPYIALCNIVCQKELTKELIQHEATAKTIAANTQALLNNPRARVQMSEIFEHLPAASHSELMPAIKQLLN